MDNNVDFLEEYMFPVETKNVYIGTDLDTVEHNPNYRAIVRTDTNEQISIMSNKYKIVSNKEVIEPLIKTLEAFDNTWYIDPSHSWYKNNRMKIQITFPELKLNDGESDIALSLFIHNSYDGSEGVRMNWGAIRAICTNGMIFGKVLSKVYGKHFESFDLANMYKSIEDSYKCIPIIQEKIEQLQYLAVTSDIIKTIQNTTGKKFADFMETQRLALESDDITKWNQWKLYNLMTWYASHQIKNQSVDGYQKLISKTFNF